MKAACRTRATLLFLALAALPAWAGGPLVLEGPSGNTPVKYSGPVTLNFDLGPLIPSLTNTEVDNRVLEGLNVWNNVSTATVQLSKGADLAENITIANFSTVLSNASNNSTFTDGINPVIYDQDGQIIDAFLGGSFSDDVAGFAASIFTVGGTEFVEGYAVLNGKTGPGAPNLDGDDIVTVVIHEIGHLIGLDHSQLDINNNETGGTACTTALSTEDYPMMYPFLCRTDKGLHEDDIIAVSTLYPISGLETQFGQLRGNFVDPTDAPILGANLWIKETTSGETYSVVSDYLLQSNGFFALLVPPGEYTLHANAINPIFFEASSVGPYASNSVDVSFINPISAVDYQAGTGSSVSMTVTAGEAVEVTFRSDGTGSNTGGNSIIDPGASTGPAPSGGSSGGSLDAVMLSLPLLLLLRRSRKS